MSFVKRLLETLTHLITVAVIGVADYLLGPDVQLSVVYLVPIITSALWLGRTPAVVIAVAGSAAWFINAELTRPEPYGAPIFLWNIVSRLVIYVMLALLVDRIRRDQVELRRLNRLREEFVAMVAHELRQPAAAMSLVAATLASSASSDPAERNLLGKLQDQARTLARLAEQLLAIGRLETGELRLNVIPTDLRELATEAAREAPSPERVELLLPDRSMVVSGDPERLRQAIDNLISNGLKYSPAPAPVLVSVRGEDGAVRLEVSDRGIGLAASDLARLFRKYGRLSRAETVRVEGVGLGLYFTRMLVEAHGGRVSASSPGVGKGATFGFSIPLANGARRTT